MAESLDQDFVNEDSSYTEDGLTFPDEISLDILDKIDGVLKDRHAVMAKIKGDPEEPYLI